MIKINLGSMHALVVQSLLDSVMCRLMLFVVLPSISIMGLLVSVHQVTERSWG